MAWILALFTHSVDVGKSATHLCPSLLPLLCYLCKVMGWPWEGWKCGPSTGKGREVAAHWFRWLRGSSSSHLERSTLLRTWLWKPKYGFIACDVSSDKLLPGSCLSWVSEGSGDVNCGVNPD